MLRRRSLAFWSGLLLLGAIAPAQAVHTQLFPPSSPSPRSGTIGLTDGGGLLVFGGLTSPSPLTFSDELWRFSGTAWTQLTTTARPPARDWYAATLDFRRSRLVVFGGRGAGGSGGVDLDDTWEFDGSTWTQRSSATRPSARRWAAMVFDFTLGKCLLFGGSLGMASFLGDTWTWDGTQWIPLAPANSPSPRARGWLTWDLLRNRAIWFGGKDTAANTALAETWIWNSSTWLQQPTATVPGWNGGDGLIAYGMTHDVERDRIVLVGGTRTLASVSPQTWEHDGVDWRLQAAGGITPRTSPAFVYVPTLRKSYLFGGSTGSLPIGETYEYQTGAWPDFNPFGTGCAGPAGIPSLTQTHGAWIGETHTTRVGNLAPTSIGIMLVGLSNTTWVGGALPFPLLAVWPRTTAACQLRVSPDASVGLANLGGTANFALPIPGNPALLGTPVFLQAAQLTPLLDLSVSVGVALTPGAK
ncbi:MAG: hypothetical protein IPK26_01470 [Planctomycetes bacterium]|nr:hypothetical protein [Planctomycetota bacterium]